MALYAVTIFLAAFLLFQIQPVIAKIILPWFGGSSAVWSTCMLFFQAVLLLGYLYAHWLHQNVRPGRQAVVHGALLALSLAALPLAPEAPAHSGGNPSWQILALLGAVVGLPYFLLATTSPLLQAWYARTHAGAAPYRLFALSNLACVLALLSYPVLVEPRLATHNQGIAWSAAYAVFAALCGATALASSRGPVWKAADPETPAGARPARSLLALWLALAGCASILLLATTSFLTQDVAAIPFLWILPLSLYLLSFIICFEAPGLYSRPVFLALLPPALAIMAHMLSLEGGKFAALPTIAASTGALFVFSMFCHGEVARRKPHPRHLTLFYVMVALGGALGGFFVGIVAPNWFDAFYELPIGLALCASLAAGLIWRHYGAFLRSAPGRFWAMALAAAWCGYIAFLAMGVRDSVKGYRVVARNFYGQLRVYDADQEDGLGTRRKLLHGVINHGEQFLEEPFRRRPSTYFCPETGVGRALSAAPPGAPRRIGILGLGSGTLAAYGRAGDVIRIYEINPLVLELARTEFSYLRETPARVETVLGDGRLALEREPPQGFDVLVMDAFSGDSVPVHLITREAFATYLRHLKPGGILAVNISNKYLSLEPVMERAASHFGRSAVVFDYEPDGEDYLCFDASWVLVLEEGTRKALERQFAAGRVLPAHPGFRMWTDDFSNMFQVLQ
jgi:SAM-dependent methyltransferase